MPGIQEDLCLRKVRSKVTEKGKNKPRNICCYFSFALFVDLASVLCFSVRPGDLNAVTEPYESEEPRTAVGLNLNFFIF